MPGPIRGDCCGHVTRSPPITAHLHGHHHHQHPGGEVEWLEEGGGGDDARPLGHEDRDARLQEGDREVDHGLSGDNGPTLG